MLQGEKRYIALAFHFSFPPSPKITFQYSKNDDNIVICVGMIHTVLSCTMWASFKGGIFPFFTPF